MIEKTIIQPSRLRVASQSIVWLCAALALPIIYIFNIHTADHIGGFFKMIFAACALVSGGMALSAIRNIWRIFHADGQWKATIGHGRLVWAAGLPCRHLPLDIAVADIAKVITLDSRRTVTDSDGECTEFTDIYELHMTDGQVLTFDRESAGIDPNRVFKALSDHGVRYERWLQDRTKTSTNHERVFESVV